MYTATCPNVCLLPCPDNLSQSEDMNVIYTWLDSIIITQQYQAFSDHTVILTYHLFVSSNANSDHPVILTYHLFVSNKLVDGSRRCWPDKR